MGAVSAQDGTGVFAVELAEPLETAVYVYVVNEKVDQPVNGNTYAYKQKPAMRRGQAGDVAEHAGNGKDHEKQVVFLKEAVFFIVRLVVVFVPAPQPAMHNVFVRKPGDEFHAGNGGEGGEDVDDGCHVIGCRLWVVGSRLSVLGCRFLETDNRQPITDNRRYQKQAQKKGPLQQKQRYGHFVAYKTLGFHEQQLQGEGYDKPACVVL